jgi:hypothetical protein
MHTSGGNGYSRQDQKQQGHFRAQQRIVMEIEQVGENGEEANRHRGEDKRGDRPNALGPGIGSYCGHQRSLALCPNCGPGLKTRS